jgi:hypothetical protein
MRHSYDTPARLGLKDVDCTKNYGKMDCCSDTARLITETGAVNLIICPRYIS